MVFSRFSFAETIQSMCLDVVVKCPVKYVESSNQLSVYYTLYLFSKSSPTSIHKNSTGQMIDL